MNKNEKAASDARAKMEKAGVDPATIALFVQLILLFGPKIAAAVTKLFKHDPKAA